jgi:DNA replication initiation complex subunit (GINS family)
MTESTITYEALYEILRKEKFASELQKLNPSFFKDIVKYLDEKAALLQAQTSNSSMFASAEAKKISFQLNNVKKIIKDIYERRENKIVQLALSASRLKQKIDASSMLAEEKELFNNMLEKLNNFREDILEAILSSNTPKIREPLPKPLKTAPIDTTQESNGLLTLRFIEDIPKFVGQDLQVYGPFEKEDIANLPSKIANLLIKNSRAEQIQ